MVDRRSPARVHPKAAWKGNNLDPSGGGRRPCAGGRGAVRGRVVQRQSSAGVHLRPEWPVEPVRNERRVSAATPTAHERLGLGPVSDGLSERPACLRHLQSSGRSVRGDADSRTGDRDDRPITDHTGESFNPSFSGDGRRLVYQSDRTGASNEIWKIDLDTKKETRLTHNEYQDVAPDWSPSADEIAFVSTRGGKPQVWIMERRGDGPSSDRQDRAVRRRRLGRRTGDSEMGTRRTIDRVSGRHRQRA